MSLRTRSSDDQLTTDGDTFKRRDEEALSSNVGRSSASPQCQPATVPKDNNLVGHIEAPLHKRCPVSQVGVTGFHCRCLRLTFLLVLLCEDGIVRADRLGHVGGVVRGRRPDVARL